MMNYVLKHYNDLTKDELYQLMNLRQRVFVVEQESWYLDADGKDLDCYHVLGMDGQKILSHARLLAKGVAHDQHSSIGRVVLDKSLRGTGEGRRLMQFSMKKILELYPNDDIEIEAQSYLRNFYESFGFKVIGDEFMLDQIPHLPMLYEVGQ